MNAFEVGSLGALKFGTCDFGFPFFPSLPPSPFSLSSETPSRILYRYYCRVYYPRMALRSVGSG
jgi:hypothetical protein